jgi:UTP--glucose-1-phosphate uridylyltransferase
MKIMHVRQGHSKGLGHAVCAESLIGDNDFIVVLPDVLIDDSLQHRTGQSCRDDQPLHQHRRKPLMIERVAHEDVSRYGVVDCGGYNLSEGGFGLVRGMVEKPKWRMRRRYGGCGTLCAVEAIGHCCTNPCGAGGEIQLTDAIAMLLEQSRRSLLPDR